MNNEILGVILSFLTEKYDCQIHYIQDNKCYYNGVVIGEVKYEFDEDNNKLDIFYHPYQGVKSINATIIIAGLNDI